MNRRSHQRLLRATAVAAFFVPTLIGPRVAGAASGTPIIFLSPTSASLGDQVSVHAMGFSPGEDASVEICGDGGLEGAQGCDLAGQATLLVDNGGRFSAVLPVTAPPVPCPCVIEVDTPSASLSTTIAIAGVPVAPLKTPQQALSPRLKVVKASLGGHGDWLSWIGWPARRTLTLNVENTGSAPASSPVVSLQMSGWGRGTTTLSAPRLSPVPPGTTRTYRFPVELGPAASGTYTASGRLYEAGDVVRFRATTFTLPWILLGAVLIALQAILVVLRNRVRARIAGAGRDEELEWVVETVRETPPAPAIVDVRDRTVGERLLDEPELAAAVPAGWVRSSRIVLFAEHRRLSVSLDRITCSEVGLERSTVVAWDDFTYAPWEGIYEDNRWSALAATDLTDHRPEWVPIAHEGNGLALDVSFTPNRPAQALGRYGIVQPVIAQGAVSVGGERFTLDCETTLVSNSVVGSADSDADENPRCYTESYGFSRNGGAFFLIMEEDNPASKVAGWLTRDHRSAPIVEGRRTVEERLGPYPHVLRVELRDSLGRTIECRGRSRNGIGSRRGAGGLVLHSLIEWVIDGATAVGEDNEDIGVEGWRLWRASSSQLSLHGFDASGARLLG